MVGQHGTESTVADLLKAFDKGDSSVKDFCKSNGITRANFYRWQNRCKIKTASSFTKVDISAPQGSGLFAEVGSIRLYQPVSASFLKELIS